MTTTIHRHVFSLLSTIIQKHVKTQTACLVRDHIAPTHFSTWWQKQLAFDLLVTVTREDNTLLHSITALLPSVVRRRIHPLCIVILLLLLAPTCSVHVPSIRQNTETFQKQSADSYINWSNHVFNLKNLHHNTNPSKPIRTGSNILDVYWIEINQIH